jgi:transposase
MSSVQEIINELLAADNALAAEYTRAPRPVRTLITRCSNAIESAADNLIAADIATRTAKLKKLTATIKGATEELKEIKSAIDALSEAGKAADQVLKTLTGLLPLI